MASALLAALLTLALHQVAQGHEEWIYSAERIGARLTPTDLRDEGSSAIQSDDHQPARVILPVKQGTNKVGVKGQRTGPKWQPYPVWMSTEATTLTESSEGYTSSSEADTAQTPQHQPHQPFHHNNRTEHDDAGSSSSTELNQHASSHTEEHVHSTVDSASPNHRPQYHHHEVSTDHPSSTEEELLSVHFLGHNPDDSTNPTMHHSTTSYPVYVTTGRGVSSEYRSKEINENQSSNATSISGTDHKEASAEDSDINSSGEGKIGTPGMKGETSQEGLHIVGHIPQNINDMLPTSNESTIRSDVEEKVTYTMKVSKCKLTPNGEDCSVSVVSGTSGEDSKLNTESIVTDRAENRDEFSVTRHSKDEEGPTSTPVEDVYYSTKVTPLCHLSSIPLPTSENGEKASIDEKTRQFYLHRISQILNCDGDTDGSHQLEQKQNETNASDEKNKSDDLNSSIEGGHHSLKELEAQIIKDIEMGDESAQSHSGAVEHTDSGLIHSEEEKKLDISFASQDDTKLSGTSAQGEIDRAIDGDKHLDVGSLEQSGEKQVYSVENLEDVIKALRKSLLQQDGEKALDSIAKEEQNISGSTTLHDHKELETELVTPQSEEQKYFSSGENQETLKLYKLNHQGSQEISVSNHNQNQTELTSSIFQLENKNTYATQSNGNYNLNPETLLPELHAQLEITDTGVQKESKEIDQSSFEQAKEHQPDNVSFQQKLERPLDFSINLDESTPDVSTPLQVQNQFHDSSSEQKVHKEIDYSESGEEQKKLTSFEHIHEISEKHLSQEDQKVYSTSLEEHHRPMEEIMGKHILDLGISRELGSKDSISFQNTEEKKLDLSSTSGENKFDFSGIEQEQKKDDFGKSTEEERVYPVFNPTVNGQHKFDSDSMQEQQKLDIGVFQSEEQRHLLIVHFNKQSVQRKNFDLSSSHEVQKQLDIINNHGVQKHTDFTQSHESHTIVEANSGSQEVQKELYGHLNDQPQLVNDQKSLETISSLSNEEQKRMDRLNSQEQLTEDISSLQQEIQKPLEVSFTTQNDQTKLDFGSVQEHEKLNLESGEELKKLLLGTSYNGAQQKEVVEEKISSSSTTKPIVNVVTEISVHHTSGNSESKTTVSKQTMISLPKQEKQYQNIWQHLGIMSRKCLHVGNCDKDCV